MQRSWRKLLAGASIVSVSLASACADGERQSSASVDADKPAIGSRAPAPEIAPAAGRRRIVILGDSLTAGLGLEPEQAYPALLQERIDALDLPYDVINAGVSGDTSAGGLRRLDHALEGDVAVLIVALGANDGLRGLPPDALRENLAAVVERATARQIEVILAGMEAPPNLGEDYTAAFRQVYTSLADEYHVPFLPFLLADVAGVSALNQHDGMHPNVEGTRIVADHVWAVLRRLLEASEDAGSARSVEIASGS